MKIVMKKTVMKKTVMKKHATLALLLLFALMAALTAMADNAEERSATYREGRKALDEQRWDDAARLLAEAAEAGGGDADAALYWRAYAQHKAGSRSAALAALDTLERKYPSSRWRDDARALRMEMDETPGRDDDGMSPEDELKLLALNSLMSANSERGMALLESFLDGDHSPELRERALFVLSQNPSPRAREALVATARGGRGPEMQLAALRYLGMARGEAAGELEEIYRSSSDPEIRKAILHAFMLGRETESVRRIYGSEKDPELRKAAIHQLGLMRATDDLRELYRSEKAPDVRKQVLHALFLAGDAAGLKDIYASERDPDLRKHAIHGLGLTHREEARDFLAEIYRQETSPELKKQVLHALFLSNDAGHLIEIARAETDPDLRRQAVRQISMMRSDEAVSFMIEILEE